MSAASLVVLCLMLCLWDPTMLLTVRSSLASLVVHNNRGFSSPSLSIRGVVPSDGNDARQPERTRLLKSRFRSFARCSLTRSQPLQQKDRQGERKKPPNSRKRQDHQLFRFRSSLVSNDFVVQEQQGSAPRCIFTANARHRILHRGWGNTSRCSDSSLRNLKR